MPYFYILLAISWGFSHCTVILLSILLFLFFLLEILSLSFLCLCPFFLLFFFFLLFSVPNFYQLFSSAQCCMTIKNLLPSKGSNCSATLSLKPNKHTLKMPQYPLKSAVPTSKPPTSVPPGSHSSQRLFYSGRPPLIYSFFFPCSSFFCHFITICTHPGEWAYIHAQTCMMRVGGFLFFFFP